MNAIQIAEQGLLPTWLIRLGIRALVRRRLAEESSEPAGRQQRLLEALKNSPLAVETDAANDQHYEIPASFFQIALGQRLKYSCCYWPDTVQNLDQAEIASLEQIAERAQLRDGQQILELGCGWGSFSLWAAKSFPESKITSVSNSAGQRKFIMNQAAQRGLDNLEVITSDMNVFETDKAFDRVVSVEMFEHMRNYPQLFARIHDWLAKGGKLFVHVFSHKRYGYLFEDKSGDDWMARHFFTGGVMPSHDLLPRLSAPLELEDQWRLNGIHYQKTANAWLDNLDQDPRSTRRAMEEIYGKADAKLWAQRWRIFMMSCAELFGFEDGEQWGVSHYLLAKP